MNIKNIICKLFPGIMGCVLMGAGIYAVNHGYFFDPKRGAVHGREAVFIGHFFVVCGLFMIGLNIIWLKNNKL